MPVNEQLQTPREETAERVAETVPGLTAAAYAEAVQDYRHMNATHRRREDDSYRQQCEALGVEVSEPPKEDEVGNLVVTGDVYGSDAAEIIRSLQDGAEPPPTAPVEAPAFQNGRKLARRMLLAAGAAVLGGGVTLGAAWLGGMFDKSAPVNTTVVHPGDTQVLGVEVVPGGALPQ